MKQAFIIMQIGEEQSDCVHKVKLEKEIRPRLSICTSFHILYGRAIDTVGINLPSPPSTFPYITDLRRSDESQT